MSGDGLPAYFSDNRVQLRNGGPSMRFTTVYRLVLGAGLAFASLAPAATQAAAVPTPPETGCPAGWQLLSLDDLEGAGYVFVPDLDANGDRLICG